MGFFNWAAPLIRRFGDRFTTQDADVIAGWLRAEVQPGGHVVDVGGGAGQLAVLLAGALEARVTVVDPTEEMISYVHTGGPVSALRGAAEDIPLPDDAADAIVVTDAFHHFRDQAAAVEEFARVVRPDGLVLILDLDPRSLTMHLIALGERLLGEPGSFMSPDQMCAFMEAHGITGECEALTKTGYRFLGRVKKLRTAA